MKRLIFISLLLLSLGALAQQDALFSQYMFNKLVLNPAYAGTRDAMCVTLVNRHQWTGLDGAPKTLTVSIHSPMRNRKVGLGLYVYNDVIGPVQDMGAIGTYSYKVRLGNGKLSFGLQAGIKYNDVDWNKVYMFDENDIVYSTDVKKTIIPDANFGVYYYTDRYYLGISSKHLWEQEFGIFEVNNSSVYNTLLRHFYGMAGYAIPLGDKVVFRPSTLFKYVKNAPLQMDLNASLLFNNVLWVGASYRTERALVFVTELVVGKKLRIGYSFDWYLNDLQLHNQGSHEIMVGYDFKLFKSRMLTPRYF